MGRGQVHFSDDDFIRRTRLLAEKWTSPQSGLVNGYILARLLKGRPDATIVFMLEVSSNSIEPAPDGARPAGARYQPLVIVLAAAAAGIVADRFWPLAVPVWWAATAAAWVGWLVLWRRGRQLPAAWALLLATAATAASWHHLRWCLFADDDLGYYATDQEQPVCVRAVALKAARPLPTPPPDPLRAIPVGDRDRLDVALIAVRDGSLWRKVSGRSQLLVYGRLPQVQPGDRLEIFAQLSAPRGARNPGEFDYADHARGDRRRSRLRTAFAECVSVLGSERRWGVRQLIELTRGHGSRILKEHLDPERSALAAAVLLGAREQLEPEETQAFVETGTIHLLAISGLHVGILAWSLLFLVRRAPIPRGWAMVSVALFTVFYMLLTDARPPVIRATVLVLAICWSSYLGRRALSFNSLAAAALVVLAINPADMFRIGAQLSFLAVAGLIWFAPFWMGESSRDPLQRLIERTRPWPVHSLRLLGRAGLRLTLASLVIWLLSLPLVMARFHLFTPAAVPLNTLLWVPMTVAMLSGFATLVLGSLAAPLGQVAGTFCDESLWLLQSSVGLARNVPGSHFWVPGPADWWLAGFYGGLGLLAALPRIRPPRRWCLGLLAGWTVVGFAAARFPAENPRLDCTFLSMGHGCAVVLELPSGKTVLYDAGRFSAPVAGARSVAGFLWSRGITHLDAVVLSHGDVDHYSALPGLLERFSVGVIYVSPVMFEDDNPALAALREAIGVSGVPLREIHGGHRLDGGEDCRIEVLHPPRKGILGGDNANSVVLAVEYLGRRILLPGDLARPGLDDVLAEEPIDCDVLMAPHHGSRRSNPPGLATWSTPGWVVISGSRRWDPGPTEAAYRAAGSRVLHTARQGAVGVQIDREGVRAEYILAR